MVIKNEIPVDSPQILKEIVTFVKDFREFLSHSFANPEAINGLLNDKLLQENSNILCSFESLADYFKHLKKRIYLEKPPLAESLINEIIKTYPVIGEYSCKENEQARTVNTLVSLFKDELKEQNTAETTINFLSSIFNNEIIAKLEETDVDKIQNFENAISKNIAKIVNDIVTEVAKNIESFENSDGRFDEKPEITKISSIVKKAIKDALKEK